MAYDNAYIIYRWDQKSQNPSNVDFRENCVQRLQVVLATILVLKNQAVKYENLINQIHFLAFWCHLKLGHGLQLDKLSIMEINVSINPLKAIKYNCFLTIYVPTFCFDLQTPTWAEGPLVSALGILAGDEGCAWGCGLCPPLPRTIAVIGHSRVHRRHHSDGVIFAQSLPRHHRMWSACVLQSINPQ